MCGIVGVVTRDPTRLRDIGRMTEAIRHRGPDDEGYLFVDSRTGTVCPGRGRDTHRDAPGADLAAIDTAPFDVAFGHRRLSILDLSVGGHQPMASRDRRYWITYNGEIYNYIELRAELEGLGFRFSTASDTEVLIAAWETWGAAALPRLNGMWAFALIDLRERRLVLSRDRFGEKPLFYRHDRTAFAFASEIGALKAGGWIRGVDEQVLSSFLSQGVVDEGERTFFDGVTRVPPGGTLVLDLRSFDLAASRSYSLPLEGGAEPSVEEFRDLLDDAIRIRRRSDVPVGTCLSGGLDSSAITALSSRQLKGAGDYHAFSALYADAGLSEAPFVKDAVSATGVIDHVITPDGAGLRADLVSFIKTQGEPTPSLGAYTQYCVARAAAAAGVKVLLDGQGADELLAGYHYQAGPYLAEIWSRRGPLAAAGEIRALARNMSRTPLWLGALAAYHRFPWPATARSLIRARGASHAVLPEGALAPDFRALARAGLKHQPSRSIDDERRLSLGVTSLPALLRYEDRNTMRFAVEARLPFLDFRVVDAGLTQSSASLFRGGWTKSILRDAVSGLLPESIVRRKDKLGFATPDARLLREAFPVVREALMDCGDLDGRLDRGFVRERLAEGEALADRPFLARWCASAIWLRECLRA
ncbi:MAG TPA: asparagine synthase (glutamine-hydrolyzing) [Vicinamibacteria bacterium]|nr:asparagine synthase (glutamine-hydrolyzing) [Vicinamibacteria bacterium]